MNLSSIDIGADGKLIATLRRLLLGILMLGLLGSGTELILLKHTEDVRQWIPLGLIGVSGVVLAWHMLGGGRLSVQAVRWLMISFVASGMAGVYFHYQGLVEFKLESSPTLRGWPLFRQAIGGKAPPLLAPGAMIQLGLLGLAYTYKHPALVRANEKGE